MKVYKFYSDGCGPCKVLEKNLKESKLVYTNIDIMNEEEYIPDDDDYTFNDDCGIVEHYNIKSVPTLIIVSDTGEEIERFTGVLTVDAIKGIADKYKLDYEK